MRYPHENMPAPFYSSHPAGGRSQSGLSSRFPVGVLILLCVICCSAIRAAQGVTVSLDPASETSTSAPIEPAYLEPSLPVQDPQPAPSNSASTTTEFSPSPRRFHYSLSFDFRIAYDDNITLSPINPIDDLYGRVEAVINFGLGDFEGHQENYLNFSYSPSYYFYSDNSDFNGFEHLARLEAQYRFSRLTLSTFQDLQSVQSSHLESGGTTGIINAANVDAGGRQRLTTYSSRLNASYDLTGKTSVTAGVDYTHTDYETPINSDHLMATLGVDYKFRPKLSLGLSGSAGKDFVDSPTPNQSFWQVNLHANYEVTGKINATASGGVESRQFDGGTGDRISPVLQVGLNYHPFDGTTIDLNASGQVLNSSVLSNQDYLSTQFTGTIRQRLFQRVTVEVTAGVQSLDYFSTVDGRDTRRQDTYYFIQPGIDVNITRYWSAGVFYLHRTNDSTIALFGFDENQVGAHSRITF